MIVIDPHHILIILDLAYIIIRNLSREVLAHFEQVFNFLCCFTVVQSFTTYVFS